MPRAKGRSILPPRVIVPPGHGGVIPALDANDVLSGRGGRINAHPGNVAFRRIVEEYKHEYLDPRTRKLEKVHVAARLVAQIRGAGGRFLKEHPEHPGCYVEIGDRKAWKKTGQSLREDAPDVRKEIDEVTEASKEEEEEEEEKVHRNYYNHTPPPPGQHPPHQRTQRTASSYAEMLAQRNMSHNTHHGYPVPRPPPGPQFYHPQYQQQHHQLQQNNPPGDGWHTNQKPDGGNPDRAPQPQFAAPQDGRAAGKPSPSPPLPRMLSGPINAVAAGVQNMVETMNDMASTVTNKVGLATARHHNNQTRGSPHHMSTASKDSWSRDFPPTMSVNSALTMSDISALGESGTFTDSIWTNAPPRISELSEYTGVPLQEGVQRHEVPLKQSTGTEDGNLKLEESVTLSELMGSRQSGAEGGSLENFALSELLGSRQSLMGRTLSFPDLLLSTGDLLPPLPAGDGEKDLPDDPNDGAQGSAKGDDEGKERRRSSGRLLRSPFHRRSSLDSGNPSTPSSSLTGFRHAHGRRSTAMSGLSDNLSAMSLAYRNSLMSKCCSRDSNWMEDLKDMQSVGSDMNLWDPSGSGVRMSGRMLYGDGAESIKSFFGSFLSDVSIELDALDLAEPLPPSLSADNLNGSDDIMMTSTPGS